MEKKTGLTTDPCSLLKRYTSARIAIGRTGGSVTTNEWLNFKLAHAKARDSVHCEFNSEVLVNELKNLGDKVLVVDSQIKNRAEYLQRPDLGRRLDSRSIRILEAESQPSEVVFIVCDGLSATAIHSHATQLLTLLLSRINSKSWSIAPLMIARFGRVALEDEIGALIKAKIAVMLIGERPGLSSPDSMGAYLVYNPKCGNTDADRNCVSNIRPEGLDYESAADTIIYLLEHAMKRKLSGIKLKDDRRILPGDAIHNSNSLTTS